MAKSILISCLSCAVLSLLCGTVFGARVVDIEISVHGEVILERGDGDDGERDADAIWEAMKNVKLRETDAFKKLKLAPGIKEYTFSLERPERGQAYPIKIDASYGGEAGTCVMTIKRVTPDAFGGMWRIDPDDVDRLFDRRMISREEARLLKNPQFDKNEAQIKEKAGAKVKKSRS